MGCAECWALLDEYDGRSRAYRKAIEEHRDALLSGIDLESAKLRVNEAHKLVRAALIAYRRHASEPHW